MEKIITLDELPEIKDLYFKKDIFGYRIVYPIKNADGTINWWNLLFGGKRNLFMLIIILAILGFIMYSYNSDIKLMKDIVEDPCKYCTTCLKTNLGIN